jgi:hypothetical protein
VSPFARLIRVAGRRVVGRSLARSASARHREVDVGLFDEGRGFRAERFANFVDDCMGGDALFDAPVGKHTSEVVEERTGHGEQGACVRTWLDRGAMIDARREGAERESMLEVATPPCEDAVVMSVPKRSDFLSRLLVARSRSKKPGAPMRKVGTMRRPPLSRIVRGSLHG